MSYKISVKDLKKPDKILVALRNLTKLLYSNVKYLMFSVIFLVLLGSIVVFLNHTKEKKENKASFMLYKVTNSFTKETSKQDKIKDIQGVLPSIKNTDAEIQANFELAKIYFEDANFNEAEKYFNIVSNKNKKFISESAELLKAITLQKNNKCEDAVVLFDKILKKDDKLIAPLAMWNMATCNITLKNKDKANEMFDLLKIKYPDSQYAKLSVLAKTKLNEAKE